MITELLPLRNSSSVFTVIGQPLQNLTQQTLERFTKHSKTTLKTPLCQDKLARWAEKNTNEDNGKELFRILWWKLNIFISLILVKTSPIGENNDCALNLLHKSRT